jgi:hypothetical protein
MKLLLRASLLALSLTTITACGGGGGSDGPSLTPNGQTPGSGNTNTSVRFGISNSSGFQDGVIGSDLTELAQNDSTTLRVAFVDENGAPVTTPAQIEFTSTCVSDGASSITPATTTNATGLVSVTYTAEGCNISDTVVATTTINNTKLIASVSLATSSDIGTGGGTGGGDTTDIRFGTFTNNSFVDGAIKANFTSLQPGDKVNLEVSFINGNGLPYTDPASVTFTSTCISANLATITPASVTNSNGLIQAQYTSVSCNGEDNVIATTSVDNVALNANVVLTTTFNNRFGTIVGGIFKDGLIKTSASTLKTGQTAILTVKLQDGQANPVVGHDVRFSSSNCVGSDLASITATAATNASGIATANYTANGCDGEDIVIAETRYEGQDLSATSTLTIDPLQVRFGSFNQLTFNEGTIASSVNGTIEAGQSTQLTVDLIDQNNDRYTGASDIFFTSNCQATGLAEIDPSVIASSDGKATVNYTARGCEPNDIVTAQTSVAGNTLTATIDIATEQLPIGGIQFISATPRVLRLNGTGGPSSDSQSIVKFKVTAADGSPLPSQIVNLSLNTGDPIASDSNNGKDAFLSSYQETTDANGEISTTVNAGTRATPIRVTATALQNGVEKTAQSSSLAITTGIPDQDSFSISASVLNIEGNSRNGETTTITVHAADRFNNPVLDGTAIVFNTEGGAIGQVEGSDPTTGEGTGGECFTVGGVCSVTLRSQNPKPVDGKVSVFAYAIGEENFTDSNGNGRYDSGEAFDNILEPFRDDNEDITHNAGEFFADFNDDGVRNDSSDPNSAGSLYDGLLCDANCGNNTLYVSNQMKIIFGASSFNVDVTPANLDGGDAAIMITITDAEGVARNKRPPAGTTVSITTTFGSITGANSWEVADSIADGPAVYVTALKQSNEPGGGTLEVIVTTPSGVQSFGRAAVSQTVTPP